MDSEEKLKIRKMRSQGETYAKIAEAVGVSANTIKSFCRRNNLQNLDTEDEEIKNVCKNCKASINERKNKKFCSNECRSSWWSKNTDKLCKTAVYELKCSCCGTEFESYGNKSRKFCSRKCYFSNRFN